LSRGYYVAFARVVNETRFVPNEAISLQSRDPDIRGGWRKLSDFANQHV
jgi:hypothetical protein